MCDPKKNEDVKGEIQAKLNDYLHNMQRVLKERLNFCKELEADRLEGVDKHKKIQEREHKTLFQIDKVIKPD